MGRSPDPLTLLDETWSNRGKSGSLIFSPSYWYKDTHETHPVGLPDTSNGKTHNKITYGHCGQLEARITHLGLRLMESWPNGTIPHGYFGGRTA